MVGEGLECRLPLASISGSDTDSVALDWVRLIEKVNTNFDGKVLTGTVCIHVVEAFYTIWIEDLLYKLTILNFQMYFVENIPVMTSLRYGLPGFMLAT
jgi:hypothetical protein